MNKELMEVLLALKELAGLFQSVTHNSPRAVKAELWGDYQNALRLLEKHGIKPY